LQYPSWQNGWRKLAVVEELFQSVRALSFCSPPKLLSDLTLSFSLFHRKQHNGNRTSSRNVDLKVIPRRTIIQCANCSLQWLALLFVLKKPGQACRPVCPRLVLIDYLQTLKERFAEQLPGKIEQIKKLRK
jgi:hypothetical protein